MKQPKKITRNPYAVAAKKRKAGVVVPRKNKRKNGKNEQRELLKENEDV